MYSYKNSVRLLYQNAGIPYTARLLYLNADIPYACLNYLRPMSINRQISKTIN
jgi:hypothetical protein